MALFLFHSVSDGGAETGPFLSSYFLCAVLVAITQEAAAEWGQASLSGGHKDSFLPPSPWKTLPSELAEED